jgi:outer membrane receptor protein involved in Fe transport
MRLASDFDGDVQFLLGAFYLDYQLDNTYAVYASTFELLGDLFGLPQNQTIFEVDENPFELETAALFGELYYDFNERTEMTFGLRYTYEEKSNKNRTVFLNQLDDPTVPGGSYANITENWDEVTGKYNITYHINDAVMVYGTLARSYKSGGFNPISSESPLLVADPGLKDFDPEYINSIEVGIKSRMFSDRVQANVSYFYYDYEDMQIAKFVEAVALNENVDASIQGIEAEILFAPNSQWLFGIDAAWLDTEIDNFSTVDPTNPNQMGTTEFVVSAFNGSNTTPELCGVGCQGIEVDMDGNDIPNSPQFSVNLTASYIWDFDSGMSLRIGTNYYWQDKMYTRAFNTSQDEIDNWKVWNANAILTSADDSWWAEAWIRNINDDDDITGQFQTDAVTGLSTSYFLLEPQTYGGTVGYKF